MFECRNNNVSSYICPGTHYTLCVTCNEENITILLLFYEDLAFLAYSYLNNNDTYEYVILDIKPENLLISKNDVLKLCDFGKYFQSFFLIQYIS